MSSFVDLSFSIAQFSPFNGGAAPIRPIGSFRANNFGSPARVENGQFTPARPLPTILQPLQNPFGASLEIIPGFQSNSGANNGVQGAAAYAYANANKLGAAITASRLQSEGIDIFG